MANPTPTFPAFLDKVVDLPHDTSYELLQPLTRLQTCHDGIPIEARIVCTCRQVRQEAAQQDEEVYIMKIKVQYSYHPTDRHQRKIKELTEIREPGHSGNVIEKGPSTTTSAELAALGAFTKANIPHVPQLVASGMGIQGAEAPFPGGYITYTVMTKMPGETLFKLQYMGMFTDAREEIVRGFLPILRSIHALGVEPIDRALRNVMWDKETKTCSIIDFELWRETKVTFADETRELQRWGLVKAPPPKTWMEAWALQDR